MAPERELFLIDGNSLAYRAYYALPDSIATSRGEPTNAIFGFASMLVKILTEYGPKATIVVWDAGMSGREVQYEPYKAERKPRPDLLREQWPHLEPLVESFGYSNVRVEGFEADDVIASLAEQAKEKGIDVMVVTGDRDAYQLADDGRVRIMTTSRGITDTRVYDRDGVIERYGVAPELIPDFIGLKGDTSDNIPGVPGIGDKTAAQLLQQYGTLEDVLAHVDEISGAKRQQNLREHADLARISRELAILHRDIDAGIDVAEVAGAEPDRSRLREMFMRFELREPLRRLEEALGEEAAAPRVRGEQRVEARARESSVGDLAMLPAGAATLAATRAGRRDPLGCRFGGRRGADGRRRKPRRAAPRMGQPAARRARLEDHQPRYRAVARRRRPDAGEPRARHDDRGLPRRRGAPPVPARRVARAGGHRGRRRRGRRSRSRRRRRSARSPPRSGRSSSGSSCRRSSRTSSCRWCRCSAGWSARA